MERDKADPMKGEMEITIKIGECEECLKAGRDTSDWIKSEDFPCREASGTV